MFASDTTRPDGPREKHGNEKIRTDRDRSSARPARAIAVLTCMDARLEVLTSLGLRVGDAHILRNAGGIATEDMVRSLVISQRLLGTKEIFVVHHTDCGQERYTDAEMCAAIESETGLRPTFSFGAFDDLEKDVRSSVQQLRSSPFIPYRETIRGFLLHVETGELKELC